jgi:membrane protein YqaA with SNARE-associated domain
MLKKLTPILGLTVVFLAIAVFFSNEFNIFGHFVLDRFGLNGLMATVFLMDFALQPFPPDILLYSYVLSGSPLLQTWFLVSAASIAGSLGGYFMGFFLQYEGAMRFIGKKRYDAAHQVFVDHGVLAVLVAALTPIPFNVMCWSAGIFKMPFKYFLPSTILARGLRYALVAALAIGMG